MFTYNLGHIWATDLREPEIQSRDNTLYPVSLIWYLPRAAFLFSNFLFFFIELRTSLVISKAPYLRFTSTGREKFNFYKRILFTQIALSNLKEIPKQGWKKNGCCRWGAEHILTISPKILCLSFLSRGSAVGKKKASYIRTLMKFDKVDLISTNN